MVSKGSRRKERVLECTHPSDCCSTVKKVVATHFQMQNV